METNNSSLSPSYQEIFQEIGRQLSLRKKILAKRTLLIVWPFLLLIIIFYFFGQKYNLNPFSSNGLSFYSVGYLVAVVLAVIYSSIIRFIFSIEKRIWIDSFFDKKNLEPAQSWRIARTLFWPAFVLRFKICLSYYLIPTVLFIVIFIIGTQAIAVVGIQGNSQLLLIIISILLAALIGFIAYGYYLKTKLRYTWFIFLDKWGANYSYPTFLAEMKKLNEVSKSETFKKSLLANVGTDSINSIAKLAIDSISFGLEQLGGQVAADIIRVYGNEASRQATDLANISAQYVLYRFALKEVSGGEQEVNDNVYNLAQRL